MESRIELGEVKLEIIRSRNKKRWKDIPSSSSSISMSFTIINFFFLGVGGSGEGVREEE